MKNKTLSLLIMVLILLSTLISGCDTGNYDWDAHYTEYGILYYQPTAYDRKYLFGEFFGDAACDILITGNLNTKVARDKADETVKQMYLRLRDIDRCLSNSVANSDINKFNSISYGQQIEVNELTAQMVRLAKQTNLWTDGAYDPAAYYIIDLWGFAPRVSGSTAMPYDQLTKNLTSSSLSASQKLSTDFYYFVDNFSNAFTIQDVEVINSDGKYYLKKNAQPLTFSYNGVATTYQLKLDLGGIGKGYAADEVERIARENGIKYGWANIGGSSLQLFQRRPTSNDSSTYYPLPIKNPRWVGDFVDPQYLEYDYASINVVDTATSTSGDNEQFITIGGKRYCHIVDNSTGKPIDTRISTVTISNISSAAEADALTTAIMVMGLEKAVEFINSDTFKQRNINVLFVYQPDETENYQVITNNASNVTIFEAVSDKFTLSDLISDNGYTLITTPKDYTTLIIVLVVCVIVLAAFIAIWAYPKYFAKLQKRNIMALARNSKPFALADIFVYLGVAAVIVVLFIVFVFTSTPSDLQYINIYSNGELVYKFDCADNKGEITTSKYADRVVVSEVDGVITITVYETDNTEHYNTIEIRFVDGGYRAKVIAANCSATKECVNNFPAIRNGNGIIICTVYDCIVVGIGENADITNPSVR